MPRNVRNYSPNDIASHPRKLNVQLFKGSWRKDKFYDNAPWNELRFECSLNLNLVWQNNFWTWAHLSIAMTLPYTGIVPLRQSEFRTLRTAPKYIQYIVCLLVRKGWLSVPPYQLHRSSVSVLSRCTVLYTSEVWNGICFQKMVFEPPK
jgi:hypothetical protein